jgi:phosphoserine phosphatase
MKLIVCDFDGTILDRHTQLIYPRVAQALRPGRQELSSARQPAGMPRLPVEFLKDLRLKAG